MKRACTPSSDLERGVVAIGRRSVVQEELSVGWAERPDRDGLTFRCTFTPSERDFYNRARSTCEDNAAGVRFAASNGDPTLTEAMFLVAIELDQRRMIAGIRSLGIHRNRIVAADGRPPPCRYIAEARIAGSIADCRRRRGRSRLHRIEKLAVREHLGPEAGVDDISAVFQKHPIEIWGDRRPGPCHVNRGADPGGLAGCRPA